MNRHQALATAAITIVVLVSPIGNNVIAKETTYVHSGLSLEELEKILEQEKLLIKKKGKPSSDDESKEKRA